jgi:DNA-binding CsgD family transcriptional regulator
MPSPSLNGQRSTQTVAVMERFPAADAVGVFPASPRVGLVLATLNLVPIYTNAAAVEILGYPDAQGLGAGDLQRRIRTIFSAENPAVLPPQAVFLSGRRQYVCRPFVLDSRAGDGRPNVVALLFDRRPQGRVELAEISRRFRLSSRESETVRHLVEGRTTKEAAQHMGVSPNTVKQFVRLAMSKMGVTSRSGIVGKALSTVRDA